MGLKKANWSSRNLHCVLGGRDLVGGRAWLLVGGDWVRYSRYLVVELGCLLVDWILG